MSWHLECHCERSEAIARDCFVADAPRNDNFIVSFTITSGTAELCFGASKHTIQASLAMKVKGYSSKVAVLLPLTEEYLGREIALVFRKLFELYIKSEYGMEFLTDEETKLAIEYAKKIFGVYTLDTTTTES